MPAARVTSTGLMKVLDRQPRPDEQVTEKDIAEPPKLARVLTQMLKDIALLKRRFAPRRIDFEDQKVSPSTTYRFQHRFNGRVRWWVVQWKPTSFAANWQPFLLEDPSNPSDANTLVLTASGSTDGTATIRVEEAG